MGGWASFLFVYALGGLTFIPLLVGAVLLHAHLTSPIRNPSTADTDVGDSISRPGDSDAPKVTQKSLDEKFRARDQHDADVAAGYFAVCREYVPGGVNGKPPERTTPVGSTIVSSPSPSVYQSMYRSIFDRKPSASPLDHKGAPKQPPRKGGNVFYVVLRHGHLMLYDDDEMVEVRHVISLAHHSISLYGGDEELPEGELWIKRNAICLTRSNDAGEVTTDGTTSKPFYLFSENCSDKEDFYFALLRNQEYRTDSEDNPPVPLQYDVKHIIDLVQRLHSSEEHLQTRWFNALLGRLFLALYKTPDVENLIRAKITKKIARVKTPSFLSGIVLRKIDMGEGPPYITNPRLKDLTVDGECVVEADIRYTGNFKVEVATTARIDLGSRFKPREVSLVLAIVLKKLEGHILVRFKPPPSNRAWITFETSPHMEFHIEPIVSSRQITYSIILRQIESRIKEVFAETLVHPHWDDTCFSHTEGDRWRGGIWAAPKHTTPAPDYEAAAAQAGHVDQVQQMEFDEKNEASAESTPIEPLESPTSSTYARKAKSVFSLASNKATSSSTSVNTTKSTVAEKPKTLRTGSYASASSPTVGTDVTNIDAFKPASPPEPSYAASAMAAISARSSNNSQVNSLMSSPAHTPTGSPAAASYMSHSTAADPSTHAPFIIAPEKFGSISSTSSRGSEHVDSEKNSADDLTPQLTPTSESVATSVATPDASTPASSSSAVIPKPEVGRSFGHDSRRGTSISSLSSKLSNSSSNASTTEKRMSLAAVTSAAANAKKWGLSALSRQSQAKDGPSSTSSHPFSPSSADAPPALNQPMGRGRPLPPPGTPLPPPERKSKTAPIPVPRRKPLTSFSLPDRPTAAAAAAPPAGGASAVGAGTPVMVAAPALPARPRRSPSHEDDDDNAIGDADAGDGMLVVAAPPPDSEPSTPVDEDEPSYMRPWVDDDDDDDDDDEGPAPERAASNIMAATTTTTTTTAAATAAARAAARAAAMAAGTVPPPSPAKKGAAAAAVAEKEEQAEPREEASPRRPKRMSHGRTLSGSPEEEDRKLPSWMAAQEEERRGKIIWVDDDAGV